MFSPSNSYYVQQFNTACLAEFAYYVESNGEAAIIDPLREIQPYLELAKSRNAKIKYVFETHFHADFVSGHVDLARETGAKIVYGPNAKADYEMYSAKDGEEFSIGDIVFRVLHTPGHTLESSCYLLLDENRKPTIVFTGDTLFLGEVGRPDLAVASDLKKEDLAGMLYDSLRTKIMTLDENVVVYPGHGAGSSCGKNICNGSSCTIGIQKKNNYALQDMTKENFVMIIASDLPAPPKYFFHDAKINKTGYTSFDEVMKKNLQPLSVSQVKDLKAQGAILVDCREAKSILETGLIPGSVAISLSLTFAVWAGTLLNPSDKLVIVAEPGKEEEAVVRLARVGFENCAGYLKGGVQEWNDTLDKIDTIEGKTYSKDLKDAQTIRVLDVRNKPEWDVGVFPGSVRIPLGELENRVEELKRDQPYHIMCRAGSRAVVAYSILKRNGFGTLTVIKGGANHLTEGGFKLEELKI